MIIENVTHGISLPLDNWQRWYKWAERYHNCTGGNGHERRPYVIAVLDKDTSNQAATRYAHRLLPFARKIKIEQSGTG